MSIDPYAGTASTSAELAHRAAVWSAAILREMGVHSLLVVEEVVALGRLFELAFVICNDGRVVPKEALRRARAGMNMSLLEQRVFVEQANTLVDIAQVVHSIGKKPPEHKTSLF